MEFNPSDPKYKKVEDLPEEWQNVFINVDNGFVKREAFYYKESNAEGYRGVVIPEVDGTYSAGATFRGGNEVVAKKNFLTLAPAQDYAATMWHRFGGGKSPKE